MMKLAIIFLPIVFALIWALFIGLRINRVETRDGKRKLVNYLLPPFNNRFVSRNPPKCK